MNILPKLAITSVLVFGCALPTRLPVDPAPAISPDRVCPGLLFRREPYYPREALNAAQDGWVIAEFDVQPDGSTTNLMLVASSPRGLFEDATMWAVHRTRYRAGAPLLGCRLEFKFQMSSLEK